jgi:hypothetical protein
MIPLNWSHADLFMHTRSEVFMDQLPFTDERDVCTLITLTSVPASIAMFGDLGKAIIWYTRTLSDIALARFLAVTRELFLTGALRSHSR